MTLDQSSLQFSEHGHCRLNCSAEWPIYKAFLIPFSFRLYAISTSSITDSADIGTNALLNQHPLRGFHICFMRARKSEGLSPSYFLNTVAKYWLELKPS